MDRYQKLSRLLREAGAVKEVVAEGITRFTEQSTHVLDVVRMTREEDVPENVFAIFVTALEEMGPLPHIDLFLLREHMDALKAEGESFLAAEEMFMRNKWPGLFEEIEGTALALGICARDLELIRKTVAIVSRSARLIWRKEREKTVKRKPTVFV